MEDRHGGVRAVIDRIDSDIRILQRQVEHCELREKQLIIMFKMIMDKYYETSRLTSKKGKTAVAITMKDIIEFMEQLVNKNLTPEEIRDSPDLLSQAIKKSF